MALPRLESFTGAAHDFDSGDGWFQQEAGGVIGRDGTGLGRGVGFVDHYAVDTLNTYSNNQYSKMVFKVGDPDGVCQVMTRGSITQKTGYALFSNGAVSGLQMWVNGTATDLGAVSVTFADGDVMELRSIGTTHSVYKNGGFVASVTEGTIASGAAGIGAYADPRFDNWEGGDAVAAVAPRTLVKVIEREALAVAEEVATVRARVAIYNAPRFTTPYQAINLLPVPLHLVAPTAGLFVSSITVPLNPAAVSLVAPPQSMVQQLQRAAILMVTKEAIREGFRAHDFAGNVQLSVAYQAKTQQVFLSTTVLRFAAPAMTFTGTRSVGLSAAALRLAVPLQSITTLAQSISLTPVALRLASPTTGTIAGAISTTLNAAALRLAVPTQSVRQGTQRPGILLVTKEAIREALVRHTFGGQVQYHAAYQAKTQQIFLAPTVLRLAVQITTFTTTKSIGLTAVVLRLAAPTVSVSTAKIIQLTEAALRLAVPATTISTTKVVLVTPIALRLAIPFHGVTFQGQVSPVHPGPTFVTFDKRNRFTRVRLD